MTNAQHLPFAPRSQRSDHIYMSADLEGSPEVLRLSRLTDLNPSCVVGCLWLVWVWADTYADDDGFMVGVGLQEIDGKTEVPGFARALQEVSWIEFSEEGAKVINPGYFMSSGQYEATLGRQGVAS